MRLSCFAILHIADILFPYTNNALVVSLKQPFVYLSALTDGHCFCSLNRRCLHRSMSIGLDARLRTCLITPVIYSGFVSCPSFARVETDAFGTPAMLDAVPQSLTIMGRDSIYCLTFARLTCAEGRIITQQLYEGNA